ncbi:MAG: phosphoadenylyl-sulfate reductase [Burkholderiales bacterium]
MAPDHRIASAQALLAEVQERYAPAAFGTSFGAEDMVLLDLIARSAPRIEVFTLDTGRLPEETYSLMQLVCERYRVKVKVFYPDASKVEEYVRVNGINGFYESIAQRKGCCHVRKVEPLARALQGKKAWVTGLRREQSAARSQLPLSEPDPVHGLTKFNPLAEWSLAEVWGYLRQFQVPCNALHDRGYPSIGCAPCTRAIKPGEDIRAGRWWWENTGAKECGLHPTGTNQSEAIEQ